MHLRGGLGQADLARLFCLVCLIQFVTASSTVGIAVGVSVGVIVFVIFLSVGIMLCTRSTGQSRPPQSHGHSRGSITKNPNQPPPYPPAENQARGLPPYPDPDPDPYGEQVSVPPPPYPGTPTR